MGSATPVLGEPLYVGTISVGATPVNLLGTPAPDTPTLINCQTYKMFVWCGVKNQDAPIQFTVRGGDARGWQWTFSGTITGSAGAWFRVAVRPNALYERYRFEVSGSPQILRSKIIGVRR
jgi:hypothetical protein